MSRLRLLIRLPVFTWNFVFRSLPVALLLVASSCLAQPAPPQTSSMGEAEIACNGQPDHVQLGESVTITVNPPAPDLFYAFGSSDGTLIVTRNKAILNTAGAKESLITIVCSAVDQKGKIVQATMTLRVSGLPPTSTPAAMAVKNVTLDKPPDKAYTFSAVVAPSLSWTTGTQTQTISGGSMAVSEVHSQSYCDPGMYQFGLAANASDTSTTNSKGVTTNLDNNDVKINYTRGLPVFKHGNNSYLGIDGDFFGNTSLGIGLQQTYTVEYQYYFKKCEDDKGKQKAEINKGAASGRKQPAVSQRVFASVGVGAGFINERLYKTPGKLNGAVLPLSAQTSYLQGKAPGIPPKLIWYGLLAYLPVLTDMRAYQLSAIAGLQIPTPYKWLTVNLSDSDLYMNNAPIGFKRNYQNGSMSFIFSLPMSPPKVANPAAKESQKGACYGGDKLARLYCYDDVTADACTPPNLFRAKQHCSAAGPGLLK
jgi:hypothetical protein